MSATEGFLAAIISRQSAQLDEYAAPEVNTALRNPMPPMVNGKLAHQYMELGGTETSSLRARRNAAPCWAAKEADNFG